MESYLRVNSLGPGSRLMKKSIYWAAVSQKFEKSWSTPYYVRAVAALRYSPETIRRFLQYLNFW